MGFAPLNPSYQARLRAAGGLEQARIECVARALAGPDHELEGLKVAFAGLHGGPEQSLALIIRRRAAARQYQGLPEHDQAVLLPEIEVPDPELFVHLRDQLDDFTATKRGNFEIECAGEVQRLDVAHPGERQLVISPIAAHDERALVVVGAIERPIATRG